jgi:NADPH:quinone reductase
LAALHLKYLTMKAIDFEDFGASEVLRLSEKAEPELRPHDLRVRVHGAGVNRADLTHRKGGYGRANFGDSEIMGLEIAGEVIGRGAEATAFEIGERVMGIVGGGGYAETARLDERMAMRIPAALDFVHAAAIPEAFVTAHEALFHLGDLQAGQSVLIHAAASGVGTSAVQLARATGAKIFVTADAPKHARLRALGAEVTIAYKQEDFAKRIAEETGGRGVDLILDFIGAPYFERNIASLAVSGRLVQVGLMSGKEAGTLPLDRLLENCLQVIGTVMKSRSPAEKQAMTRRFAERWLPHFGEGKLMPVVDSVFPLAEAAAAHRKMESHLNIGKIVLTP